MQLEKILKPLYEVREGKKVHRLPDVTRERIQGAVGQAAEMARRLRTYDDIVYYWPPTFKDGKQVSCVVWSAHTD